MSKIRVNCPECKSQVVLEKELLAKTNGHAVCPECTHTFKLVKKSKAGKDAAKTTDAAASKDTAKTRYQQPVADNDSSLSDIFADKPKNRGKAATHQRTQKPLNYRIPKAEVKNTSFGEVGEGAFAFNMLDRDSINSQLPVTIKPAGGNSITHAPMQQEGQQNHITIHTDSLVFTLVGDGQAPALPQTSMALAPMSDNLPMAAPQQAVMPVAAPAPANETNWTIATIVALIILIIQLFNFILMLL